MSGAGKSTVAGVPRERGYAAYDADDGGFTEPRADGLGGATQWSKPTGERILR